MHEINICKIAAAHIAAQNNATLTNIAPTSGTTIASAGGFNMPECAYPITHPASGFQGGLIARRVIDLWSGDADDREIADAIVSRAQRDCEAIEKWSMEQEDV